MRVCLSTSEIDHASSANPAGRADTAFARDRFTWSAYIMLAYYAYLMTLLGPLMPFLRAELGLNYTVGGLHFSAFALGMILAGLSSDRLGHRLGRQVIFWGGGAGMAAGGLVLISGERAAVTIAGTFLMGFLGSMLLVTIQATLSDRHGERRSIALTESNTLASVGSAVAPFLVGSFQQFGLGWRGAILLGIGVLGLAALWFAREPLPAGQQAGRRAGSPVGLPGSFWIYWVVIILSVSIEWCTVSWGADFLKEIVGLTKVQAASLMTTFFVAMVLGRFGGSRLARIIPGPRLLLMATVITSIGVPLFWLTPLALLRITGLFIAGLGVANLFPLTLSAAVGTAPGQTDTASARVSMGAGLAILTTPLLLGWVADQVGIGRAFGLVALLAIIAAVVAFLANDRFREGRNYELRSDSF